MEVGPVLKKRRPTSSKSVRTTLTQDADVGSVPTRTTRSSSSSSVSDLVPSMAQNKHKEQVPMFVR